MINQIPISKEHENGDGGLGETLRTRGLFAFYGKQQVLRDVSLTMRENRVTAIIGPPGSGKSTFVRCLNRMHEILPGARMEGSVELGGQDVYRIDPIDVRRAIGMVFSRPNPFPSMCIFDNVAAGLRINGVRNRPRIAEQVERSLRLANLWEDVKDRLQLSSQGLSRGQQQCLCIARALALQPAVLLMDEPTSTLDPISTLRIEELIEQIKSSHTIVMVTHNLQQAARVADDTAFFLDGELIEHGGTSEIFTNPVDKRTEDYVTGRFG